MIGNTREDDLLNKLKNCIGALQNGTPGFQDSRAGRTAPAVTKENYQAYDPNSSKNHNFQSNAKFGKVSLYNSSQRQPLTVPNYNLPAQNYAPPASSYPHSSRNQLPANSNRFQPEPRQLPLKQEEYRQPETTPRKFDYYAFEGEREEKYPVVDSSQKFVRSKQEVRGQISRRYSFVQNQRKPSKCSQYAEYNTRLPTRNYQQQVEERKELLDSAIEFKEHKEHKEYKEYKERTPNPKEYLPAARSYNPSPNPTKIGVINSTRKEPIYQSREPTYQPREQKALGAPQQDYSSRKEKPMLIKETLQRAYEESSNPNECSALVKLRKISQLNEKINDRIRNIINVFQEHKC